MFLSMLDYKFLFSYLISTFNEVMPY